MVEGGMAVVDRGEGASGWWLGKEVGKQGMREGFWMDRLREEIGDLEVGLEEGPPSPQLPSISSFYTSKTLSHDHQIG